LDQVWHFAALLLTGIVAGAVNALAGGGPILTLGGMVALGVDPKLANLTSTVALSPGQLVAGEMSLRALRAKATFSRHFAQQAGLAIAMTFVLGGVGGLLLLLTDAAGFRQIVVWLVLFATGVYAWAGYKKRSTGLHPALRGSLSIVTLAVLSVYGGYFGGGNSFLVLALLAAVGLEEKDGAAAKNILVAAINAGAVVVILASSTVIWSVALPLGLGGLIGSFAGAKLLDHINPSVIRPLVIFSGLAMAAWFFLTA
jgi:uncharacterized membrane protein YfcA